MRRRAVYAAWMVRSIPQTSPHLDRYPRYGGIHQIHRPTQLLDLRSSYGISSDHLHRPYRPVTQGVW